jgi:hypothetical protein
MKRKDKYKMEKGGKKERSLNEEENRELRELRDKVAQIPQLVADKIDSIVKEKVAEKITSLMVSIFDAYRKWDASGQNGPPPIPTMVGSNWNNNAVPSPALLVSPSTNTAAPDVFVIPAANTMAPEHNAPGTAQEINPSVSSTPDVGGPSTAAELDALKVTKRRRLNR